MRSFRLLRLGVPLSVALPALLGGCGHSAPTATLSVTCNGSLSLAGASSIQVESDPGHGTRLTFPDPANPGHTGTLPIAEGQPCTIAPELAKGS